MATELERLKMWMQKTGFDTKTLAEATGVGYNALYKMISDRRHISDNFKYRFGNAFGFDLAFSIFDDTLKKKEPHPLAEQNVYPAQYAAHRAVGKAQRDGELQPANKYKCLGCDEQAEHWHHPSYHPDDHLSVVPLCRACHGKAHSDKDEIPFGVVPTAVGVVRIAIAEL